MHKSLPYLIIALFVAAAVGAVVLFRNNATNEPSATVSPRACTQEAKICPDGSAVGRTGPDCSFAPCPTARPMPTRLPPTY